MPSFVISKFRATNIFLRLNSAGKYIFYSNKSPEWPLPSTDKINTDSSTCDNTTKAASTTLNATSSGSNEWVKPNATKVGAETAAKGMQY